MYWKKIRLPYWKSIRLFNGQGAYTLLDAKETFDDNALFVILKLILKRYLERNPKELKRPNWLVLRNLDGISAVGQWAGLARDVDIIKNFVKTAKFLDVGGSAHHEK
jgi:succinyl-CoA synthetase beta subunit